jgi:aspartyl-tRNA(Asn)/glutamyl-tRNA(Gln) amidotransferase subunit A
LPPGRRSRQRRTTARKLVEECLARIADPAARACATFIHVDKEAALAAADAMDRLRKAHAAPSPYAGIPVSIKDLYDIKGQVTRAGSRALEDLHAGGGRCAVVARLRRAGFIVIGRTNMTEFAYSGIGINPHYGTPKSAWNRSVGHVPGGSSSGAAVSIADRWPMARSATDTGGSCRIPAAFNGIVGYKPTQAPRAARRRRAAVVLARQLWAAGAQCRLLRGARRRAGG